MSRILVCKSDDPQDPIAKMWAKVHSLDREAIDFCCEALYCQVTRKCDLHGWECPDYFIQIGVAGIRKPVPAWTGVAGNATYEVKFCPFCGKKLPEILLTKTKK